MRSERRDERMEERTYTLKLSNGETYEGVKANGTTLELPGEVSREALEGGLRAVEIWSSGGGSDGSESSEWCPDISGRYSNVELVYYGKYEGFTSIVLRERKAEEVERERLRADVDYILMLEGEEI